MTADCTPKQALMTAIHRVGSQAELMRLLNLRGYGIKGRATIGHWVAKGTPPKYCPDIEELTDVRCEALCPGVNWSIVRRRTTTGTANHQMQV